MNKDFVTGRRQGLMDASDFPRVIPPSATALEKEDEQ